MDQENPFPGLDLVGSNAVYLWHLLLFHGQAIAASDAGGLIICRLPRGRFLIATVSHNFDFVPPNDVAFDEQKTQVCDMALNPVGNIEQIWHYPNHDLALVICSGETPQPVALPLVDPPTTTRESAFCLVVPRNTSPGGGTLVLALNEQPTDMGLAMDVEGLTRKTMDLKDSRSYSHFQGTIKNREGLLRKGWCVVRQIVLPSRPGCSGMPVFDARSKTPSCYGILRGGSNPDATVSLNSYNRADIVPSSEIAKALTMFRKIHPAYLR